MARFKLYIEYDGTRYSGWQLQKNAKTVQGILLKAAYDIFKADKIELQGSGRTDGGVHALCQVGHLDVKTVLAPEIIRMKFNDILPPDINLIEVEKAKPEFHSRHDAVARSYVYIISKRRTSFNKNYVWWIKDKLDFGKMSKAAGLYKGMHDFKSFADKDSEDKSTKVLINDVECVETDNLIYIRIVGSHFLWKMVRRMVGVLTDIGRGRKTEDDLKNYLSKLSAEPAKSTAPPSGLFLENVYYKGDKISKDFIIPLPNL